MIRNISEYIKQSYREAFTDLRDAGASILVTVAIFLVCVSIGMVHPSWSDDTLSALKGLAKDLSGKSASAIIFTIFLKNALSTAISVLTGPLLGIIPVSGAVINGLLLGSTLSYIKEMGRPYAIVYLFPHGLFEFPAMFMAWGLGLWQGMWFLRKPPDRSFKDRLQRAFRVLVILILPLLIIAALIEGTSIYIRMQ